MAASPVPRPVPGAGASAGAQGAGQQRTMDFVKVAQAIQQLGQQYPEAAEDLSQVLPLLQRAMAKVAGNPQRTAETQAPPLA